MASKLILLEEELTRQPQHPAKTKSNVVFAFNGSTRIDHARQATITQVGGPSYTVSSQGRCIVLNDFTKYISVTKGINFLLADFVILFVFSQVGSVANGGTMLTFVGTAGNANRVDIYTLATGVVRADVYNSTGVVSVVDSASEINTGGVYAAALEMRSGYLQWRINGKISGSSVGFYGQRDNESSSFTIGEGAIAGAVPNHETALVAFLCGDDRELTLNPWQIFEPEEIPLFKPVAIGATLAQTESADTVTSAANVQLSASLAVTESNDSLSSAATVAIFASLSVTESSDTVTASATIIDGVNASLSVTESDDTLSASSSVPLSASLSYTESADSASGSASVTINATATLTEAGDSISGVSVVEITATASLTESADSLSASATLVDGISASLNVSEASDTLAAVANAAIAAALSESEAGDELSAQAAIALSAAMNAVESGDTVVSAVSISITCSASLSENGDTLTATASIISDSNTITAASMVRLAEIWARMELDATKPLSTSATLLTVGTISQDISTGGAVRTGAAMVPSIDPDTMIAEVWQRLGLDPDNALTQTNTSIDVGDIHLTVSGTDTLTVQRV